MARKRRAWSYSAGERRRNRVTVFERSDRPGRFVLQYSVPNDAGGIRTVRSHLPTRSRDEAKRQCDEIAAKFASVPAEPPVEKLTLRTLVDRYLRDVTPSKASGTQVHDRIAVNLALRAFGSHREPRTLDRSDWNAFIKARRTGVLVADGDFNKHRQAKPATINNDLRTIRAMLQWATTLRDAEGRPPLADNPFAGFPLVPDPAPARPRLPATEWAAILRVAPRVHPAMPLALVLVRETGHRIGAVRQLRWADFDLTAATVTWRWTADKIKYQHTTPLSDAAVAALRAARGRARVIGDAPVFPSRRDPSRAQSGQVTKRWWREAERLAEIPHVDRRAWHTQRRAFADELRDVPLKDLADLGGWKSIHMPVAVYQGTDLGAQRRALAKRARLA